MRNVAIIQHATQDTWQAAAWWLERRFPEDFALRQHLQADVQIDLTALLRGAVAARQASRAAMAAPGTGGDIFDLDASEPGPDGATGAVR